MTPGTNLPNYQSPYVDPKRLNIRALIIHSNMRSTLPTTKVVSSGLYVVSTWISTRDIYEVIMLL